MLRRLLLFAATCALALASSGAGSAADEFTPALRTIVQNAQKEGSLSLTWGETFGGAAGVRRLEGLVNKKFGTHITFVYTPGPAQPEMASRMMQELAAGRPASSDLLMTSMSRANADLFQPIDWRQYVPRVPAEAMKFGGRGVAYETVLWGITYNTNLVRANEVPHTLKDLLKPQWQGKLGVRVTPTAMGFLGLAAVLGPQGALGFYKALAAQAGGFMRCGNLDHVSSGEFVMFYPDCGAVESYARTGAPVAQVIPAEGGAIFDHLAGIPKNAPHPNAAKLFVAYLLTTEGQRVAYDIEGGDSAYLPGSQIRAIIDRYKARGVRFYDTYDVEAQNPKLVAETEKAMAQILAQSANK